MTDLRTLTDAFAELERQADAFPTTAPVAVAPHRSPGRWPLVAAACAGVLAVATGTALVLHDRPASHPATAAGSPSHPVASRTTAAAFRIPTSPDDLAARFRTVLDGSATFTVTDTGQPVTVHLPVPGGPVSQSTPEPNGAAIVGRLTAGGVTGGFDLQILRASPGAHGACDTPIRCAHVRLPDGGTLALGRDRLVGGGETFVADLVRADRVEILMHVSNEASPKGGSTALGPRPPLTTRQLRAIVTSDRW